MKKDSAGIIHLGIIILAIVGILIGIGIAFFGSSLFKKSSTQPARKNFASSAGNLFINGSEKLKECLKQTIGEQAYQQIAQEQRGIEKSEEEKIFPCFERFGYKESPSRFVSYKDLIDPSQLSHHYPRFIKCALVAELPLLRKTFELKKIKEDGLNTVCIYLSTPKFSPSMRSEERENHRRMLELKWALGKIKEEGLAITLLQDLCCYDVELEMTKGSSDVMLKEVEKEILMWAKVAEEYQVEYLTPLNEIDGKIDLFREKENLTQQDIIAKTNKWHSSILPKLRNIFHGRLIIHYSELYPELNPQGYDYFGSTLDHYFLTDIDKFRQKTKETYQLAIKLSDKYKVDWLIPEVYFPWEETTAGPQIQARFKKYQAQLKDLQDDYFRISFEEILNLPVAKRPKGYGAGGNFSESLPSLTDESRQVIAKFLSMPEFN